MSSEVRSASSSSSSPFNSGSSFSSPTSAHNLTVPSSSPVSSESSSRPGLVRRLSQIACNFANNAAEHQLTDEAIKELGENLLKDYVRDRLFRNGFLYEDSLFIEENNNLTSGNTINNGNGANSLCASNLDSLSAHRNSAEGSQFLHVAQSRRPLSRSNSFTGSVRSNSPSGRNASSTISPLPADSPSRRSLPGSISPISPLPTDSSHPLVDAAHTSNDPRRSSRTSVSSQSNLIAQPVDAIAVALRRFCLYLEKKHSNTYREVSRPLCITMASLDVIGQAIRHVAEKLIHDIGRLSHSGSHLPASQMWAKIASLFVLTSSFCLDCTVQGHPDHMSEVISMFLDAIFCKEVCSNIRSVGGWSNLVEISKDNKKEKDLKPLALVVCVGAVFGVICSYLCSWASDTV